MTFRLSPWGNIVDRGGAKVDNLHSKGWQSVMSPVKNVIFILSYRMSHFYNKFHRRETLSCDIQNCHPANWPIRLLEINMRYNKTNWRYIKKYIYYNFQSIYYICTHVRGNRFKMQQRFLHIRNHSMLLYLVLNSSNLIGQLTGWQFWMSHDNVSRRKNLL